MKNPNCHLCRDGKPHDCTNTPEMFKSGEQIGVSESKPREFWIGCHVAIVDAEMIPILLKFRWHVKPDKKTSYAYTNVRIGGKQTSISMHRLLSGLPASEIDHINRNGLDNRSENLRFCSKAENQRNRIRKNTLGYRGVYKPKNSSNYAAQIMIGGKRFQKRGFKTAEDAAKYYDELSKEHHGEFGIRNFKD